MGKVPKQPKHELKLQAIERKKARLDPEQQLTAVETQRLLHETQLAEASERRAKQSRAFEASQRLTAGRGGWADGGINPFPSARLDTSDRYIGNERCAVLRLYPSLALCRR